MLPGRGRDSDTGSGAGGSGLTTELLSALDARTQTVADSGTEPDSAPAPEPSETPSPLAGGPDLEQARRARFTMFRSRTSLDSSRSSDIVPAPQYPMSLLWRSGTNLAQRQTWRRPRPALLPTSSARSPISRHGCGLTGSGASHPHRRPRTTVGHCRT